MTNPDATTRRGAAPIPTGPARPLAIVAAALTAAGCISVKAPDKPIEINLNIAVKQEVVVSLKKDAEDVINANPELFPK